MIPLKDENPTQNFPLVTVLLIAANVAVFFSFIVPAGLKDEASLFDSYGLIPLHLLETPVAVYPTVFSAMFLHSGLGHLAGNMLYLWIFGNNIEDVLGKTRFILFYLVCGAIASFCHIAADPRSEVPMVGASGAISGILGAYLVLFPFARVRTLVFLGFFITIVRIPAVVLLGIWFLIQISSSALMADLSGGVAWYAHIGGFAAGILLILPFRDKT
ncbi:MAG: rhomboid family intramembrane serine protease [Nitrospinae bacterium]|nr:rhomboid family intramembrane serine protease [Nitrospinota bacterium]